YMTFPGAHRAKLHSTNPIERLNGEIKRRTDVVGIFPNEAAIVRLVGAILLEENDEWAVQRRFVSLGNPRLAQPYCNHTVTVCLRTGSQTRQRCSGASLLHHGMEHDLTGRSRCL